MSPSLFKPSSSLSIVLCPTRVDDTRRARGTKRTGLEGQVGVGVASRREGEARYRGADDRVGWRTVVEVEMRLL